MVEVLAMHIGRLTPLAPQNSIYVKNWLELVPLFRGKIYVRNWLELVMREKGGR